MNRQLTILIVSLSLFTFSRCTKFEYDNPLDLQGINQSKHSEDSLFFYGDDDLDSIGQRRYKGHKKSKEKIIGKGICKIMPDIR